jgi:hypothetical protein
MQTPAIIASLTVVGSIAYATGSQGVVGEQTPLMPSGSQAHSMQEEIPQARMQMTGGCQTDPALWFNPIPKRLVVCIGGGNTPQRIGMLPLGAADVNRDGVNEFFDTNYFGSWDNDGYNELGVVVRSLDQQIGGTLLYRSTTEVQPNQTIVWRNSVLDVGASVGDEIRGWLGNPSISQITMRAKGWRDIDSDGDLDLIAEAAFTSGDGVDLWFENIGYEMPAPPIAADLNHDGNVDGADLGLLLYAWGQTQ